MKDLADSMDNLREFIVKNMYTDIINDTVRAEFESLYAEYDRLFHQYFVKYGKIKFEEKLEQMNVKMVEESMCDRYIHWITCRINEYSAKSQNSLFSTKDVSILN